MTNFSTEVLKAISDYKFILRKTLSLPQCTTKMRELGIKRKNMMGIDEPGLYKIGLKIIRELKKQVDIDKSKKSSNSYQGAKEFLQYLEELFSHYHVEKGKVVHLRQKSSCAILETIQLISISKGEFTSGVIQKIKHHGDIVTAHGSEEQKKMFFDAISVDQDLVVNCFPQS
ncbi:MAG: hypothetical protein KKE11_06650 [Gammaproteobacteria bacterium]|nr:hypothetical protein [Gammaproteobacteria bacterium]